MRDRYVRPIFSLGDSHCGPLHALVLFEADDVTPMAVGTSICVQGLSGRTIIRASGELHPGVVGALAGFHLLSSVPDDYAGDRSTVAFAGRRFIASSIAASTPVLFTVGELDAREIIASIPLDADPTLPFETDVSALPALGVGRTLPAAPLHERVLNDFRPIFAALMTLVRLGVARVALASLPPPTLDDAEYERLTGISSRARTRYKVHLLANSVLRTFCAQANIGFVDAWDAVTERNVVKPGALIDGLHVGYMGSQPMLRRFHRSFAEVSVS
jgi:hypothetical protein